MSATYVGQMTLPIFTRTTAMGELIYLGDMTIDVPINVQADLPIEEIEEQVQAAINENSLTGAATPDTPIEGHEHEQPDPRPVDRSTLEGPHSTSCQARLPHPHGDLCHRNCPTCGSDGILKPQPLTEKVARPQVPSGTIPTSAAGPSEVAGA